MASAPYLAIPPPRRPVAPSPTGHTYEPPRARPWGCLSAYLSAVPGLANRGHPHGRAFVFDAAMAHTVTLTADEVRSAHRLAHERQRVNRRNDVENERKSSDDDEAIAFMGAAGEMAVAKLLGGTADTSVDWGDPPDVRLPNGETVEVKTRRKQKYDFHIESADPADVFEDEYGILVWCTGGGRDLVVVGWTTPDHFLEHAYRKDRGHGECLWLAWQDLRPLDELMERLWFDYPADALGVFFPPEDDDSLPFN